MSRFDRILAILALLLMPVSRSPAAESADVYIRAIPVSPGRIDIVVGNSGRMANKSSFDAFLQVISLDRGTGCTASTNFITPLDPGMSVRAFELRVPTEGATRRAFSISAAIHFWDGGDADSGNDRHSITFEAAGAVQCVTLKPRQ